MQCVTGPGSEGHRNAEALKGKYVKWIDAGLARLRGQGEILKLRTLGLHWEEEEEFMTG
jgi:hypothetical protein